MADITFKGQVLTGLGEGTTFVSEAWAKEAFAALVHIDPWPGTFNLKLTENAALAAWDTVKSGPGIPMTPPDPAWCAARLFPAVVGDNQIGTIVLPEIASYPADKVEIISPVHLREALGVEDGDVVEVTVFT